jgi:hypothetical protein
MENLYVVVKDYIQSKDTLAPDIIWFTDKQQAIDFAKEQIDFWSNVYKDKKQYKNRFMDFFQWKLYIPWLIDICVREIPIDLYHASKTYQKHPNCLSK